MEYSLCMPRISHGITGEDGELGTPSSSSSLGSASSINETSPPSPELTDDATSEGPGESPRREPAYQMSSLMARLPFKRGLSKHFDGKSRSFTSLAMVGSLEDLAKPERIRPCKKKLKPCKSYAAGLEKEKEKEKENQIRPRSPVVHGYSKAISKRGSSRGGVPGLLVKRPPAGIVGGGRPPVAPPHGSGSFSTQTTLLFA